MKKKFLALFLLFSMTFVLAGGFMRSDHEIRAGAEGDSLIKWVDFDVTYAAMKDAMDLDIKTYEEDLHIDWVQSLAYLATRYGGNFSGYSKDHLYELAEKLESGSSMSDLTKDMKYYDYYYKAYGAVIGNFLGLREDGTYGLTAYSPIGEGYWYTDSDDFGNGRDYGFARKHLGHDMFCSVGTPVMAVEDGKVEALGWNQYGGWRIGIRSNDNLRYYYYAHLRKDSPYAKGLKEGSSVKAGQLIGYTGQTGYSIKENVNNINVPHLHFGMELVFDESQKECLSEIWIDTYAIIRLLSSHKAPPAESTQTAAPLSSSDTAQVPILMYHGLTTKQSQVNSYFIPSYTFESDMKYLKENGYTSITMTELIDYTYDESGDVRLPEKPVVITFDDGYCNNYNLASPALEKYGMKAVISVIGSACEEASQADYHSEDYCNVTWDQLKEMEASGLWEVQNHTYNLHEVKNGRKGANIKHGESEEAYRTNLKSDLAQLQIKIAEATGVVPNTFTWPFGSYHEDAREVLKELGFKATLSCNGGINEIRKGDTESLYLLKRNLRDPKSPISELL